MLTQHFEMCLAIFLVYLFKLRSLKIIIFAYSYVKIEQNKFINMELGSTINY